MARRLSAVRIEARRLRCEERKSYNEIATLLNVSKGNLHYWLKDLPLTESEITERRSAAGAKGRKKINENRKYRPGPPSKFRVMVTGSEMSKERMARISGSAVQFRLVLAGLNPFNSPFDGERTDILVENPVSGRVMKIQVKTVRRANHGRPFISLRRRDYAAKDGVCRYKVGDFDFIVGYDLHTDIAYVVSWGECEANKTAYSIRKDDAERWDKLI